MRIPRHQSAFTLLELLVVVFILSIMFTFAVISVDAGGDEKIKEETRRLTALIKLASEEAIINSVDMLLQLHREGYQFAVLSATGEPQPYGADDQAFRPRELPDGIYIKAELNGEEVTLRGTDAEEPAPAVLILSSGEMTPFVLQLQDENDQQYYQLRGEYSGQVDYLGSSEDVL